MVVQNLYQIFKFTSSFITRNEYNIKNYTIQSAYKDENIVSIGDNILFQQLRKLNGNVKTTEEIFNSIQNMYKRRKECKKIGEYKKAGIYTRLIAQTLFVPEVINVLVEKKSDFKAFSEKGFDVNGEHFTRFLCGSGQMRRNTITFVRDDVWHKLRDILSCQIENNRAKEFNLAKYDAYFALSFSSVLWVRRPRVCVIKDFFNQVPNQNVDWIEPDEETGKKHIVKRVMNIELNCADGQGLIDPEFSKLWAEDMHLTFTPCSFVVRSCFIKGNLVPFDFKEYAREHNISTIKDRWGKEYRIEDVDVLISESQFKTHKYYGSWQEYWDHVEKYDIRWGVARYNKKFDDENVLANYQYIQTLELSNDEIKELIDPTVRWIKQVCSGDTLYSLLYMYGKKQGDTNYQDMYSSAQSLATKAVIKNVDMLKDSYVQRKIYKNIVENINKAKIGKVWIRGNYQFMISDPIAQCQAALGLKPLGEIPADHIYSNFWNERRIEGYVDCCRSPMIDQHEHNPSKLYNSEEASKWYKHIYSGIIYSIYDTSTARHEDSDFDGDIVLSTNNKFFVKGSHKNQNIITYEKGKVPSKTFTIKNFVKKDMMGLGTKVGQFSNYATIMYAMMGNFKKENQKEQRDELTLRIKLLREIVGQEIDKIKGVEPPRVPAEWKQIPKIDFEKDSPEVQKEKWKKRSMVIAKKPYFFRYLYPELNQRFKRYENNYNDISIKMFGIKFKKLLKKPNKSQAEMGLVRKYLQYNPLITSPCNMNILCKELESVDFDIKFDKDSDVCMLPTFEDRFVFDQVIFNTVKKMYSSYNSRKKIDYWKRYIDNYAGEGLSLNYSAGREENARSLLRYYQYYILEKNADDIRVALEGNGISSEEFIYYCHKLANPNQTGGYKKFNWTFAWDVLGDNILKIIPQGKTFAPVRINAEDLNKPDMDEDKNFGVSAAIDNAKEYLGEYFLLKDVSKPLSITTPTATVNDEMMGTITTADNAQQIDTDVVDIDTDDIDLTIDESLMDDDLFGDL